MTDLQVHTPLIKLYDDFALDDANHVRECWLEAYEFLAERCGSPIERRMLSALLVLDGGFPTVPTWMKTDYLDPARFSDYNSCTGYVQAKLGRYTADFLIVDHTRNNRLLVVECDGHDFHERTKKQAAHDRSRDRSMLLEGIRVMRFTGSEIYRGASDCALQVIEALNT